eukprot:7975111-Alexandrium_andersonii.AAC.1
MAPWAPQTPCIKGWAFAATAFTTAPLRPAPPTATTAPRVLEARRAEWEAEAAATSTVTTRVATEMHLLRDLAAGPLPGGDPSPAA